MLFQDYETQLEWLAEALAQRPPSGSLFDAVLASVAALALVVAVEDWDR